MARVKIQEYKAKQLLYKELNISSVMLQYSSEDSQTKLDSLDSNKSYVVKVDQGIKGRFKKGLVVLDKKTSEIQKIIKDFEGKGYGSFFIEEYIPHIDLDESYLSIERIREGKKILYSKKGGVDIEKNQNSIQEIIVKSDNDINKISLFLDTDIKPILESFDKYYFSFLEINPLVFVGNKVHILDLAVEIDSVAEFFVRGAWSEEDFVSNTRVKTKEEEEILKLSAKSQAAFKLDVLNPNGSIFMLLSGGGASIVLADEVYNLGKAKDLANYGEYSGNPNEEETYIYTKNLLNLLINSKAGKKVLVIGGGVANFTDIKATFKGVIRAMDELAKKMEQQRVKVFVRRGGPNQKEGLAIMENFLKTKKILGKVSGPEMVLTDIVIDAMEYLKQ